MGHGGRPVRKAFALLLTGAMAALVLSGCASNDAATAEAPKGAPPNTIEAPPGAKNPVERGMEEQKAQSGTNSDQDGGGQDGK